MAQDFYLVFFSYTDTCFKKCKEDETMFDMIHAYKQGKILTGTIVWHFNIHAICNGQLNDHYDIFFFY